jgi:lipid-binding SYLF domain-containing protein
MRSTRSLSGFLVAVGILAASGCAAPRGQTVQEKREYVLKMKDETLAELYRTRPEAKLHVESAPGYAAFSNISSKIFLLATGRGFGVVVNNETGKTTFMRMVEAGGGVGLGLKDFRAVYVFNNQAALDKFIASGWEVGGDADAAVKAEDKGLAATVGESVDSLQQAITIYQFTKSGVALAATAVGTKFYIDEELN